MRKQFLLVCLAILVATVAHAQEQTVSLQAGEGPVAAMLRVGCDKTWFSQVVADTPLDPAKFRHLPVGQKLKIVGDCTMPAPPRVADLSRDLMRADLLSAPEAKNLQAEVESLRGTAQTLKEQAEAAATQIQQLTETVSSFQEEFEAEKQARAKAEAQVDAGRYSAGQSAWLVSIASAVLGAIVTALIFILGPFRRRVPSVEVKSVDDDYVRARKEICVDFEGTSHRFPLSEDSGWKKPEYVCGHCGEKRLLVQNLKSHLAARCHNKDESAASSIVPDVEIANDPNPLGAFSSENERENEEVPMRRVR